MDRSKSFGSNSLINTKHEHWSIMRKGDLMITEFNVIKLTPGGYYFVKWKSGIKIPTMNMNILPSLRFSAYAKSHNTNIIYGLQRPRASTLSRREQGTDTPNH